MHRLCFLVYTCLYKDQQRTFVFHLDIRRLSDRHQHSFLLQTVLSVCLIKLKHGVKQHGVSYFLFLYVFNCSYTLFYHNLILCHVNCLLILLNMGIQQKNSRKQDTSLIVPAEKHSLLFGTHIFSGLTFFTFTFLLFHFF